ncbi:MAG: helix-turn-helix domain-containing protein [Paracoccaceae bacterium]|jgi:AraC family carnitine catabolism transcriptional activator|nr:helix-turn-helix domain-containing protein [Paracoccaceae bacterium]MDP7186752.1 helix-turn-helix domain-containing protein [Paracoccaceae bacterium]
MKTINIVLGEGFSLVSLSMVTEPLRVANRESPKPLFQWRLLSVDGTRPRSSSGLAFDIGGPLIEAKADVVILLASYSPDRLRSAAFLNWLRRRARQGCLMGCVETGALLFAEAGLLEKRPAAVHRESIVAFREARGDDLFVDRLYNFSGDRFSSAGGVVTMDMTLALIAHFGSQRLARRVAEVLYYLPRESDRDASIGADSSLKRLDRNLARATEIMMAHIETPLRIGDICQRLDLPGYKLQRLFQRHLGQSPQAYYLELRLERARNLLRNSHEKVGTIAMMCGFPAPESLSRAYLKRFGVRPSKDRTF